MRSNQGGYPRYSFYVIIDNQAYGGWDHREDAQEQVDEIKESDGVFGLVLLEMSYHMP